MPCQPSGRRIWAISGLWWVGLAVTGDGRETAIAALMTAHCASLSSVMSPDKHLRPRNVLARE